MSTADDALEEDRNRFPRSLPLVGRAQELLALEQLLDEGAQRTPLVFLSGEGGVGKSRLATELAARARRRGWSVPFGRAYPVETGVPYALFADAFLPLLQEMDPETVAVLSRGGEAELHYLFPALGESGQEAGAPSEAEPDEFRTRLRWNFAEFLKSLATRNALLVILEDLQWADDSSLQLLHFLARQLSGHPVRILGTYNEAERERNARLVETERSLLSLNLADPLRLRPLSRDQVLELVGRTFEVDAQLVREFSGLLFQWTRGNAFFLEEILKSLVASGRLSPRKGTWVGWDAKDIKLPGSVRDAVRASVGTLSPLAREVAELAAVIGTRASHRLLASVGDAEDAELLSALEELCDRRILAEALQDDVVVYDFPHPLVRQTLYEDVGLQRARVLHGAVAQALEALWGEEAAGHADELAYHYSRTDGQESRVKAALYLAIAGGNALERHADREAAAYLEAALERCLGDQGASAPVTRRRLTGQLAHAHLRLGEYEKAARLWSTLLEQSDGEPADSAPLHRFLGLALFWGGDRDGALDHFAEGIEAATTAGADKELVRLRLGRSQCLQELGRGDEALAEIVAALPVAEGLDDTALLAKVHRSLAQLHVWIGPPEKAREHAERAIELSRVAGDTGVEFWSRWALAVLSGLTGNLSEMSEDLREATGLAERLRSPVLRLWTAELAIELAYATGDWDGGVALGEQSIAMARNLNQHRLLPRLLVWTSLFYVGRGAFERAKRLVDEACEISGLGGEGEPVDVHLVVPAYIGLAHYALGTGQYHEAMDAARRGIEIAEGTGYVLWAMHRLLAILAEACLWAGELDEAEEVGKRMRAHGRALDHKLGMAWADACDALVRWKRGDAQEGAELMREAAEALEALPMIPDASRIRRQRAGRLAEIGDREGSLRELRRVHDVFVKLGAELELEKARIQFREVGHRPPPRGTGEGLAGLTAREMEIARLVAARKSNKAIGKALGISPRTVSTHLSNIFQKVQVTSRGELADYIREESAND